MNDIPVVRLDTKEHMLFAPSFNFAVADKKETAGAAEIFADPKDEYKNDFTDYDDGGVFKKIVSSLGGEIETGDWTARWTIGGDEWRSEIILGDTSGVYKSYEITGFNVYKNGEKLDLDFPNIAGDYSDKRSYYFTLSDIEKMTGGKFELHRNEGYCQLTIAG